MDRPNFPVTFKDLPLDQVQPNPENPRKEFGDPGLEDNEFASVEDLAESIKVHGVLNPIRVRPLDNGMYQIISGERRWRASRLAGETVIPALVVEKHDRLAIAEEALVENLTRKDLTIFETVQALQDLAAAGRSQEEIGARIHKSRSTVANLLRMAPLLTPAVREAAAVFKFRAFTDLFVLGPTRLNEEAVLFLIEHSRALTRDFRRELNQYDNPVDLMDAVTRQLAKQDLEFGWEDQPTAGPESDFPAAANAAETGANSNSTQTVVAPVHFIQDLLQVRLVAGRKLSFIVDLRTGDDQTTRRAALKAASLLQEFVGHLEAQGLWWQRIQEQSDLARFAEKTSNRHPRQ